MLKRSQWTGKRIIGFATLFFVLFGFSWFYIRADFNPVGLVLVYGGVIVGLGVYYDRLAQRMRREIQSGSEQIERINTRFNAVLQLNHHLVDVQDEKSLLEAALAAIGQISGVEYLSLIPLDEWDQPLPAFTHGPLSAPLHHAWQDHLVTQLVRERCAACQGKPEPNAAPCPLLVGPFSTEHRIVCLPMRRGRRMLGVLNLYLKQSQEVEPDVLNFIESLLNEIGLVIQGFRLQSQENSTLRQLQLMHGSSSDLPQIIERLMLDLHSSLDADGVYLSLLSAHVHPQKSVWYFGNAETKRLLVSISERVITSGQMISLIEQNPAGLPLAVVGTPVQMPNGGAVWGALCAAIPENRTFTSHLTYMARSSATHVALLLQGEMNRIAFEYRAVVDERLRLAREIHDGLAQTLAYLKLTAAQMQTYASQQNYKRLEEALKDSYRTLSEAYLDTREAIDYLRVSPENDFETALRQLVSVFLESTDIPATIHIDRAIPQISPEIQTQILRIAQEALSNVRKHSAATAVQLTILGSGKDLILEVQDNGRGFSAEDVLEISQHGLRGMRERAELIGADFQIVSQPGQGAKIRLRLPFVQETQA